MRIYKKVVIDMETLETIEAEYFEYDGPIASCTGGGSSGGSDTVDEAYNAGMLELSQEQQEWAETLYNQYVYGVTYNPNEVDEETGQTLGDLNGYNADSVTSELEYLQNVVNANQDLLGLQTETDAAQLSLTQEQIAAQSAVLPSETEATISGLQLSTAQNQASQSLIADETEAARSGLSLTTAQNQAAEGLIPTETEATKTGLELTTAQNLAGQELLPYETEAQKSGLTLTTAQNQAAESLVAPKTALTASYISDAMEGLNVGEQQDLAQAEVQHGFKTARETSAKNLSSYGLDPSSGLYASQNRDLALSEATGIAAARTQAKQDTEETNFNRKQQALQTVGSY